MGMLLVRVAEELGRDHSQESGVGNRAERDSLKSAILARRERMEMRGNQRSGECAWSSFRVC
jgi:hypothetical protein